MLAIEGITELRRDWRYGIYLIDFCLDWNTESTSSRWIFTKPTLARICTSDELPAEARHRRLTVLLATPCKALGTTSLFPRLWYMNEMFSDDRFTLVEP